MDKINWDQQWKLSVMNPLNLRMEKLRMVDLPHDYCIEQKMDPLTAATASNAYLPGGVIEYEKTFTVPDAWQGKKIAVEFEGVYMNATVTVNRNWVTRHPYGYTSFVVDLTPYIRYGEENVINVRVDNSALPNTRWYSGMGIYRHVWLRTGDSAYIEPWGVFVTTPEINQPLQPDGGGMETTFSIQTRVGTKASQPQPVSIKQTLLDGERNALARTTSDYTVSSGESFEATQTLRIADAQLWGIDHPYLYTVVTEIICAGAVVDTQETTVGVRHIAFDRAHGFRLNGEIVKLKGGCVHHDCGILGAASYDRAEMRKAELLKNNGYNAVRCAHNPPAPAFLDACDRLGILVIDEAFDCWNESKMNQDYSVYFADWWERDLTAMIIRDRNHPSVIMWSVGNEIPERDGRSGGYAVSKQLTAFAKALDGTRPITNALCDIRGATDWAQLTAPFAEPLDVVGYNYLLERYETDGELFPQRIICGTETFPMQAFEYWESVEKHPHVIGDFVWTAIDYLGESGIGRIREENDTGFVGHYPWSHANCGDIDLCGNKRPQSYYRDCVWGVATKPYLAVHNPAYYGQDREITRWGWPDVSSRWNWLSYEGKDIQVDIYSADDEVELFINGVPQGRKKAGKANQYRATYTLTYEPGELLCVAYTDNQETSRTGLKTPAAPYQIKLTADRTHLTEGRSDISYLTAQVLDKDGNLADQADNTLYICAQGAGKLLAIGSANPKTDEPYVGNVRKCFQGALTAVVLAHGAGDIVITASAESLVSASLQLNVSTR